MSLSRQLFPLSLALLLVVSSIAAFGFGPILTANAAPNPVALDGSASEGCGDVASCTLSLSTSQGHDVIIVGCDCFPYGESVSVKDSAHLTFAPRESQLSIGGNQFIQTWYAISASPLSSDQISVTTTFSGETWYGVVAFGVSGAEVAAPFVTTAPLPQANLNCGRPCNTAVSTPAGSFVFQIGGDTGGTLQTGGPGMSLIRAARSGQDVYAQYQVPSSAISSATISFGTRQGSDFGVVFDAINPAATSSSTSSSTTSSTTTSRTTSSTTSTSSTSTSSTSTSSTSTSSSAGRGIPGDGVFFLGAAAKASSALPNTGARSTIQVQTFDVPVGCAAFWVSDDSASNLWMQVGYYICYGSTPVVFTQVWNLATNSMVYGNTLSSTPTPGNHEFAVQLQSGNTWVATYDGVTVGTYNLGASVSSSTYPIYALSEENSLLAAISIPTTSFPVAIQAQQNGAWSDPSTITVYNYGGMWGLQGPGQNPQMPADSFVVGGLLSTPSNGLPL